MVDVLTSFTVTLIYSLHIHQEHGIQNWYEAYCAVLKKRGTLQQLNVFIRDREERVGKIVGGIYFLSLFESYNAWTVKWFNFIERKTIWT